MAPLSNFQQDNGVEGTYQESLANVPTPKTYEEAASALKSLAEADTVVGRAKDSYEIYKLESKDTKRLTAKQANEQFPGMETPFRQDVAPSVAKYLHDQQALKYKQADAAANGPQDMWSRTKYMGVGLWAHATDPVETGAAIIGSALTGGLAGAGVFGEAAATVSAAVKAKNATMAARIGLSIAENVGGGLAMGSAQELAKASQASAQGQDYNTTEGLHNLKDQVLAGVAFGTALPLIGKAFEPLFGKKTLKMGEGDAAEVSSNALSRRVQEMSPEAKVGLIKTAVADASELRVTNPKNLVEALSQETNLTSVPGKFNYEHTPVGDVIPAGKKFFVAMNSSNFEQAQRGFISDAMGDGTHMTDNPGVANATAARSMNESHGVVQEVQLSKDAKAFNIDRPFGEQTAEEAAVFQKALEIAGDHNPTATLAEATPKEIIDHLHDLGQTDAIDAYQKGMKELGYDALVSSGESRNGTITDAHNAVMMLDDSKIVPTKYFSPDPLAVKPPNPAMLASETAAREGIQGRLDIDPAKLEAYLQDADSVKFDSADWASATERGNKEKLEMMDALAKQGDLDAGERAVYERLQALEAKTKDERTLTKAALGCLTGIL